MAGDSAFRRLLLDTVSSVIGQPPSASALIELLRIATPKLQRGKQAEAKVRDASQRAKLLKVLQLRIHPDKHAGDETVTEIFQKVTTFYENCVDEMEKEDARRRWSSSASAGRNDIMTRSRQHHESPIPPRGPPGLPRSHRLRPLLLLVVVLPFSCTFEIRGGRGAAVPPGAPPP